MTQLLVPRGAIPPNRWALPAIVLSALLGSPAAPVDAQSCAGVALTFAGAWTEAAEANVRAELEAALATRDLELCRGPGGLAALVLSRGAEGAAVGVTVEVADAVTQKRLERTVPLAGVPNDSEALAIAVAADELLLASWAELALAQRAAERERVPPVVRESLQQQLDPAVTEPVAPPLIVVEIGGAVAVYGEGTPFGGGIIGIELPLSDRLALGLRGLVDVGASRANALGALRPFRYGGTVALSWLLAGALDRGGLLGVDVSSTAALVRFDVDPRAGATGSDRDSFWLDGRLGVTAGLALPPIRLRLRAGIGAVLDATRATDVNGDLAIGAAGVEGYAELLLGAAFR